MQKSLLLVARAAVSTHCERGTTRTDVRTNARYTKKMIKLPSGTGEASERKVEIHYGSNSAKWEPRARRGGGVHVGVHQQILCPAAQDVHFSKLCETSRTRVFLSRIARDLHVEAEGR